MKYIAFCDILSEKEGEVMEFLQLKYFQHAAKTENFSRTAESYHVPPSCVSLSVKRLERELDTKLFDRTSNKLTLNENGRILLESVENIFAELERVKNILLDNADEPSGKIHILIMTNRRIMTQIISEFRNRYRNVSFIIDLDVRKDFKRYDIIISDRIIERNDFSYRDFVSEEIRLAVDCTNPIASRTQIDVNMLKKEKFICLTPNHSLRKITDTLCEQAGFSPDIVIECDDPFYIREYVKMGMGVSLVPVFSWQNQFDDSVSLIKINAGVERHSKIYTNMNASPSAKFFAKYIAIPTNHKEGRA